MTAHLSPSRPSKGVRLAALTALVLIIVGGCSAMPRQTEMPERDFDSSESFIRMDDAIAETIAGLPDFPGFHERAALKLGCPDEDYVSYELQYTFPENTIGDTLVTEEYFEVLKEHWPEIGYEIHAERDDVDGNVASLEARRPDGVNVWYDNLMGQIIIHAQAGCVIDTGSAPPCPPPMGGVTEENDLVRTKCAVMDDESSPAEPSESASDEAAVDPFGPIDRPGHYGL